MKGLFIKLYLDEDVDVLVAKLLRSRGFTALTTQEANQLHASDENQLAYATQQEMTILTHNRVHFEKLAKNYIQQEHSHFGIIIATRRQVYDLVHRLLKLLNHVTADEMKNQTRYI